MPPPNFPPALIPEEASGLVVIVDPYSTGCLIAQEISKRGYLIAAMWSDGFSDAMKLHVPQSCGTLTYHADLTEAKTLEETVRLVREAAQDMELVACIAGGEAGVDLADALSEALGVQSNGTEIPNRRDKKIQQELIKAVGMRSVRQAGGTKWDQVTDFLKVEPFPVVLKPTESAGSDGVKLCYTLEEAKEHFELLMKSQMVNGGACPAVLCQEFLRGTEYVVDHVSLDGVHKTVMLWKYDKRPANGNAFVYFGCVPVDSDSPEAKVLIPYVRQTLDCMGVKNGPSHGEVMITEDGPCLVEMNCRAHGGDGNWRPLCKALTGGYSQVEVTADAILEPEKFARIPDKPCSPFKASGLEVIMVSFSKGKVKAMPGYDVIKLLPSFLSFETGVKIGSEVDYTIDLNTGIGSVMLMHPDEEVIQKDTEFIRYMEKFSGVFTYDTKLENLKRPRGDTIMLEQYQSEAQQAVSPKTATGKPPRPHRRVFSSDGPMLIRHMSNDRPELRGPLVKRMTTVDASNEVVVLVDPYSTGCCIASEILKRGFRVMALWTKGFSAEMKTHVPLSVGSVKYLAEIDEAATLPDTMSAVYKAAGTFRVVACLAGGEAGVDLADALSERMTLRTNGTVIPNKRDKKLQQELIAQRGMRAVRQAGGSKFEEVEKFLKTEPFPIVLKPVESAGSDGVKLCHTFEEAKEHFEVLMESQMVNGGDCPSVLCQEFLRGKEYVVDHVSRDGVHKTVMVWVYDKRPVNGAAFVYFGCVPVASDSPEAKIVIPYVRKVLDSLGIKNGPSHGEVMMTKDGPCLVEMNPRAHGGDGNWRPLCVALNGGYSQVEASVDAYLNKRQFDMYADRSPAPFKAAGQEVILVSFARGIVKATPGFEQIKKLQSYVYLETGVQPGSEVDYTVDLFTGIGSVILMHRDPNILDADVKFIRKLEYDNALFEYETVMSMMKSPSTGNLLDRVTEVSDRNYE